MPGLAGAGSGLLEVAAIGREREADRGGQPGDGAHGRRFADAEARDEHRDARTRAGLLRAGIDVEGPQASLADAGEGAVAPALGQARVGCGGELDLGGVGHADDDGRVGRRRAVGAEHADARGLLDLTRGAGRPGGGGFRDAGCGRGRLADLDRGARPRLAAARVAGERDGAGQQAQSQHRYARDRGGRTQAGAQARRLAPDSERLRQDVVGRVAHPPSRPVGAWDDRAAGASTRNGPHSGLNRHCGPSWLIFP